MPPTEATKSPGSHGYCRNKKDLGEGKTGLAWKVVLIWQIVRILRTALCALSTRHEFCQYWSTTTSSCSERGPFHRRSRLWLLCFPLGVVLCFVCCVAPASSSIVSPRRNRPAHCAADVVKGRPLYKKRPAAYAADCPAGFFVWLCLLLLLLLLLFLLLLLRPPAAPAPASASAPPPASASAPPPTSASALLLLSCFYLQQWPCGSKVRIEQKKSSDTTLKAENDCRVADGHISPNARDLF